MVAKTSILKELETIYGKSGNQLYVCMDGQILRRTVIESVSFRQEVLLLSLQTGIGTGTEKTDGNRDPAEVFSEYYKAQL